MTKGKFTVQLCNFDALGLISASDIRHYIEKSVPDWHLQGIPSISYCPEAFVGFQDNQKGAVIGLYNNMTHEISVRVVEWKGIDNCLRQLRHVLDDNQLSMLQRKRIAISKAYVQFRIAEKRVLSSICHEIGHHVYSLLSQQDPSFIERWRYLYDEADEYVTAYAGSSAKEDFAECYMTYINDRDMMQQGVFHAEYDELRRWFS